MSKIRAHIIISGMVQGVNFRYAAMVQARSLGVFGWIMNRDDGDVEAVFEGDKTSVENMVAWCHRGPSGAIVKNINVEWEKYKGEFKDFGIEY